MSSVSLPVTRPAGRALLIGSATACAQAAEVLGRLGFEHVDHEDPYSAMADLATASKDYAAVVVGLQGLYREELHVIAVIKQRFPHIEVWLTELEGRQSAFAEALRLGADGLLGEEGLHAISVPRPTATTQSPVHSALTPQKLQTTPAAVEPPREDPPEPKPVSRRSSRVRRSPPDSTPATNVAKPVVSKQVVPIRDADPDEPLTGAEPILTADELRALLQESPSPAEEER